jgi:hypothetical protein
MVHTTRSLRSDARSLEIWQGRREGFPIGYSVVFRGSRRIHFDTFVTVRVFL